MSYTNVYPSRINWENEPSIASPINATNLNKMDYALYQMDQTLETWDVTKANQSDLLLSVKSIDYDTSTGVFVFTWQNGTTKTVDLNIEKIPVSFSMSPQGVITMTTADGATYTADVGALIKTYTFTDSSEIDFTVTTDSSGNKTVTASIVEGSITGSKLEPNYLANCQSAANSASGSATAADGSAEDSEAWAVGTRDGVPVPSTDPAYENNSKYWATQGGANSLAGLSDTSISSPTAGQVLTYNSTSQKWENDDPQAGGGSTIKITTLESSLYGRPVTISDGTTTLTGTFSNSGVAVFEGVTITGTLTVSSSTSGGTATTMTIQVPYFGNYEFELTNFAATITVTYTTGATCTCVGQGESYTATSNPQTFTVHHAGTYTITVSKDGDTKSVTITITTDGQSESITVDLLPDGSTVTPTDSVATWLKCAAISDKSYTTLSQVMGDSVTFNALLGDSNANAYLARSTTWASTLCASQYAMNLIGQYDVCCDALLGNSTWVSAIANSTYMGYVLNVTVPIMTSATTPSGVVSASSEYSSSFAAYKAFDGVSGVETGHRWNSAENTGNGSWIEYDFGKPVKVVMARINPFVADGHLMLKSYSIQTSNDDTWTSPNTVFSETLSDATTDKTIYFANDNTDRYTRLFATSDSYYTDGSISIGILQFYGHASTGEKIHGANEEVAYYLDGATQVPISNPSTLDAGTYTFGSTIAKNPDSLSSDYTKSIRITPNTVEVVLRPDNALYWWGYQSANLEVMNSTNGWTGTGNLVSTFNTNNIQITSPSGIGGVASKTKVARNAHSIAEGISGDMGRIRLYSSKNVNDTSEYGVYTSGLHYYTKTSSYDAYVASMVPSGASHYLYALWYE